MAFVGAEGDACISCNLVHGEKEQQRSQREKLRPHSIEALHASGLKPQPGQREEEDLKQGIKVAAGWGWTGGDKFSSGEIAGILLHDSKQGRRNQNKRVAVPIHRRDQVRRIFLTSN